tara:strand:+ start:198 stop:782 length:585 start_codon:yes stop_codon:yes gene_type:complete
MARQKSKLSDRFKSGGNKDGSAEEKFFTDTDIQIDPEWKVIELLRAQLDDVTDAVNANDAASGSYATLKREYITTSGSLSTRTTLNDAKATNVTQTIITGNAGTVTNGVYTTGTQTIAGAKTFSTTIIGSVNGNSATTSETTITSDQATAIEKSTTITNSTKGDLVFGTPDRNGNMTITLTIGRNIFRYTLQPD